MSEGFYKRRRGILEHLEAGRIGLIDLAVHDYLNLRANLVIGSKTSSLPAGVCMTSAVAIHAFCSSQISERAIQRSLEHLERIGWIKRWNVRGKRGNYPILVCRASVHDLSGKEYRVNGLETVDWRIPKYDAVVDPSPLREVGDAKLSGNREGRTERREKGLGAPRERQSKQSIPFPDGFDLTEDMIKLATDGGLDPRWEFDSFRDHHLARGNVFRDWKAAWGFWVRNAVKFA